MRRLAYILLGIVTGICTVFYCLRDYNTINGNYLGKQKEYSRFKIARNNATEIANEKQKLYKWSKEERDKYRDFYLDSLDKTFDKGIYIPGLAVFKKNVLDKNK